jgi:hypothetical protein
VSISVAAWQFPIYLDQKAHALLSEQTSFQTLNASSFYDAGNSRDETQMLYRVVERLTTSDYLVDDIFN